MLASRAAASGVGTPGVEKCASRRGRVAGTSGGSLRLITLLTDFGHQDPFVGMMKGVILRLCPEARIVDLCHETPPYNILGGSFLLQSAVRFFPAGTIHVAVVDPGVGGPRRPIVSVIDQQVFVAPDNGLLSYPMAHGRVQAVRVITASAYFLHPVSPTFHGRDVFAPVAAHLARGIPVERLGPEVSDAMQLDVPRAQRDASGAVRGQVLWIDRFGNCITNVTQQDLGTCGDGTGRGVRILLDGRPLGSVVRFFGEAGMGGAGAVIGSTGHLELFSNQGNLAREQGVAPGSSVYLVPAPD
jgi:S-adenosyl-L-methionine hydrolase (adenosine-forming)